MPARRARLGGLAALLLALLQLLVGAGWRGGPPQCLAAAFPDWAECPAVCNCKWTSGKRSALCTGKGLTSLPILDPDMQILDLSGNRIVELQDGVFETVRLLNLQKVFLRNASLERVHQNAFYNMKGLVEVDLSENGIVSLEPGTFAGNDRLRLISLSGNPISQLAPHQFPKLQHLKTLELRSCHLLKIHKQAFSNVPLLETISLEGNKLEYLEAETMTGLKHLKTLGLDNNPWRCDCRLRKFYELLTQGELRRVYSVPLLCTGPERARSRRWEDLRLSDFACEPRVWLSAKSIQQEINGNVSLACLASGDPVPEVWWKLNGVPVNGTPYATGPNSLSRRTHDELPGESVVVYSTSLEAREHHLPERWNNLTIYNVSDADGGEYTCHAKNIAGTAEGTTVVSIPRVFSAPTLSQTDNWLLWLSLAGGGGLALCASLGALLVALACLCSARGAGRRRAKRDKVKLQASASFGDQEKKLLDLSVTTTNSATASQQLHSQSGNDSSGAASPSMMPCAMVEPSINNHVCQLRSNNHHHQHHQFHHQLQHQSPPLPPPPAAPHHHQQREQQSDFELELEPRPPSVQQHQHHQHHQHLYHQQHQHPSASCSSTAPVTVERLGRCQPAMLNELPGLPVTTAASVVTSTNGQPVVLPAIPPSVLVSVSLSGPHCVRVASPEFRQASPAPPASSKTSTTTTTTTTGERCYPDLLDIGLSSFATLPRRSLAGAGQRTGRELGSPYDNMGPRVTATGSSTFSLLDPEMQLATAMPLIQPPPEFVSL